jgi:RNA polymerase sigma factor (sigma-70 family)
MQRARLDLALCYLRELDASAPSDAELLGRFCLARDPEAFARLVKRHGPVVLGICRRMLGREQDAEGVFQATFLVLARRAAGIRKREAIGSWLHGVATRLSLRARAEAWRREHRRQPLRDMPMQDPLPDFVWRDLRPVLDEEIARLPSPFRQAFILCQLQGKTHEQAAKELGCPVGTVLSRLTRARKRLRVRLTRRGITLPAGVLAAALASRVRAGPVPSTYLEPVLRAAQGFATGNLTVAEAVSASAILLAEGVLKAMFLQRVRWVAGILLLAGLLGTVAYSQQGADSGTRKEKEPSKKGQALDFVRQTRDRPFSDPDKEAMRIANKLLQEEIEDEKAKLDALQKKLERLSKSGIKVPQEDEETTQLKRENRHLNAELRRLQEEVRLAQEDVQPYMQALQERAGRQGRVETRFSSEGKK